MASRGKPRPFALERFFAKWEFVAKHLACCSDCEPLLLPELLATADGDVLERWNSLRLAYTESQGLPALREAIAANLHTAIAPEQLVVCVPEEGVFLGMQALLQPGDTVVATFPAYQSLTELAEAAGARVVAWKPAPSPSGRLEFNLATAKELIVPGVKLVVVNFPHNPTGAVLSSGDWQALLDHVASVGAWLFSDEMYRFLEHTSDQPPSAADRYAKAISLCGLSKSWGLPGLRLGWLACQDAELIQQVLMLKDYTTICSPATSEVLALAAVRATPQLTQRCRDIIAANVEVADGFFARWPATFEWHRPLGGPIAFPRLKTGEAIEAWCDRVVTECGVLLLPATVYFHEPSIAAGRFRLGLGRKDLPGCLRVLDAWLVKHYGRDGDA